MDKKDQKLSVMMDEKTLEKIEYYRFKNKKRSKSEAAYELILKGLEDVEEDS